MLPTDMHNNDADGTLPPDNLTGLALGVGSRLQRDLRGWRWNAVWRNQPQ